MSKLDTRRVDKAIDGFLSEYFRKNHGKAITFSLLEPSLELLRRGGKRWRPLLMEAVYKACGGRKKIDMFFPIIELLHNATLIHDDIEDSSEMRRGKKSLHLIYGIDNEVNHGSWMFFAPLTIINKVKNPKLRSRLYKIVIEELENCHKGQSMDIFWHNNDYLPTEKEYFEMTSLKTGSLASMAARFGAALAGKSEKIEKNYSNFAKSLGIAFQIQDDILNISGDLGKTKGDDITEGKKSLLVIKTIEKADDKDKKRLLKILKSKTTNNKAINEAIKIIKKYDSIDYAKKKARAIVEKSWKSINKSKHLEKFKDFVIKREV